jgi:hypothetical protein
MRGLALFKQTGDREAYGIVSRDCLCWHIGPLLSVRHLDGPIVVPIAVRGSN